MPSGAGGADHPLERMLQALLRSSHRAYGLALLHPKTIFLCAGRFSGHPHPLTKVTSNSPESTGGICWSSHHKIYCSAHWTFTQILRSHAECPPLLWRGGWDAKRRMESPLLILAQVLACFFWVWSTSKKRRGVGGKEKAMGWRAFSTVLLKSPNYSLNSSWVIALWKLVAVFE